MLYEFKLDHDAVKTTKNICCTKGEGAVDQPDGSSNFVRAVRTLMIRWDQAGQKSRILSRCYYYLLL